MNTSAPSFSIIIPVYNGAAFVARAIESCLQQTVLPAEVIVVDDASTDNTGSVVSAFGSTLVKYIRNEHNSGPSFSRNRGMQQASADWILFLDADDLFHPEKIGIVQDYIMRNPTIRAIGHAFALAGEQITLTASRPHMRPIPARSVLLKNPVVTPALCVAASNGILFNESMSYAEDHDFVLRTSEQYGFWFIDLPLCTLQRVPLSAGGLSSNRWKMRRGEMNMYMDYCKRHHLYPVIPLLMLFSLVKHARQMLFATHPSSAR